MPDRLYSYVGPGGLVPRSADSDDGVVESHEVLVSRVKGLGSGVPLTFVVDSRGRLRLASRQTEHVVLAGGGSVLAAGEITFEVTGDAVVASDVSNQSTGFCPELSSWVPLASALERLGVGRPVGFSEELIFRRCDNCGATNIVKEGWFVCAECGSNLPRDWNF